MADFQTKVNLYPAPGVPGAFASVNPVVSTAIGRIAGEGGVNIGGFCWDAPANEGYVLKSGTGTPLGFVARDIIYPIFTTDGAQNTVPKGRNVNVQVKGDFYVEVAEAVTKGQAVFASTTDGTVKGGDAGTAVDGYVETDYRFLNSAADGEIATISNWAATASAAGSTGGTTRTVEYVSDVSAADDTLTVKKNTLEIKG